jgi:hypothetical protein
MSEPETNHLNATPQPSPARAIGLRLFASVVALTAGTAALVVAIVLLKGVLT